MDGISQRIAALSPERHKLLERWLQESDGAPGPTPLSSAQQRLWFLDQLQPGSSSYNMPSAWCIVGPLDIDALRRGLSEIVRRHEVLRTTFHDADGQPVQVIAPKAELKLPVTNLGDLPKAEARRLVVEDAERPFDLLQGPLFRSSLLQLGEAEHVLLLNMHHIVSDGWSMGILFRELSALYAAYKGGRNSALEELAIQYSDWALWQREQLQGEVLQGQLSYWKRRLAEAPNALNLPTDRPRRARRSDAGATLSLVLCDRTVGDLEALARREGATLFMALLAVWKVLAYRYTAQPDVVVGSPIANRNRAETEGLIGFFVNTLALRTDLSGNPTFRELLGRVRETALGAYAHQDLPFERLVEELNPERDPSRNPLFQVTFSMDNTSVEEGLDLQGTSSEPVDVKSQTAKFELGLSVSGKTNTGLVAEFEFDTDLFDEGTVDRMLGHYGILLDAISANPDWRILDLPLLTGRERHKLLEKSSRDTKVNVSGDRCVHDMFEEQVERTPYATALSLEGEQITYLELNRRANRLAHHLRFLGVGPEIRVGVCVERSLEAVTGLLGVLKAGGAYVPLDPAYPQEHIKLVLEDSQVSVLLTKEEFAGQLPQQRPECVFFDRDRKRVAAYPATNPHLLARPSNLAYVIYTSGSTGTPKGVGIQHNAAANHFAAASKEYDLKKSDRVLQFASLSFDASLEQIISALAVGATLIMRGPKVWSTREFADVAINSSLTVANFPTGYWNQLMQDRQAAEALAVNRSLRLIIVGGDTLPIEPTTTWLQAAKNNTRFLNAYGPTEATVTATTFAASGQGSKETSERNMRIGRPFGTKAIYILDERERLSPVGVTGELYIGGAGVARGYLGRPGLTAERFVPDPFSGESGARLYRTGDLARWLANGDLEFLGRADHQVKVRGFRVELGEVEAVLERHPEVTSAVVVAREDAPGDKRLVAYVIPVQKCSPTSSALRGFLKETLPGHMVPSAVVLLDRLPLMPNGKLDRGALPEPVDRPEEPGREYAAPRTPLEKTLARVWSDILGVDRVGVHDDFFDLGGHSLLAVRLVVKIRDTLQVELSLRDFFEARTVAENASYIEAVRWVRRSSQSLPNAVADGREEGEL